MENQHLFEEVEVEEVYTEEPSETLSVEDFTRISLSDEETPEFLRAA